MTPRTSQSGLGGNRRPIHLSKRRMSGQFLLLMLDTMTRASEQKSKHSAVYTPACREQHCQMQEMFSRKPVYTPVSSALKGTYQGASRTHSPQSVDSLNSSCRSFSSHLADFTCFPFQV
ncbi:unnamed protein product [Leuciscus chuanchicus]